ncbi:MULTISPECIES: CoA transferase [unclassified Micromonospora]|uniref:CoA transferase n=1 Tax=unclassified Micromonospora TaxID=2617518 RepID=UPI00362FF643
MSVRDNVLTELRLSADAAPRVTGEPCPATLSAPLAVAECAVASVAACLAAAAELSHARAGRRPEVTLDTGHVVAAVRGEALLRDAAGRGIDGFAPLSRLWRAADGWVRTHANYPWHRAALLTALGVADGPDAEVSRQLADAVAARPAGEVETLTYAAGGLAVAARTPQQWWPGAPPQTASGSPLVAAARLGDAPALPGPGPLPASGLRVLDLTRVIAGPVATRMLAALGADVLRVDDPRRPELPLHAVDGVIGKASCLLDAGTDAGRDALHRLVAGADVVVTGYRPGALRRLGLAPDQVADRHPGTIVACLTAWGTDGAWGARRGFDSLVQVATGIAWTVRGDDGRPGALPCQLLDHATGYLLAAGVLAALARRERAGEACQVSISLARTARWLLDQGPRPARAGEPDPPDPTGPSGDEAYRGNLGDGWRGVTPPGRLDGHPLHWPHLPPAYGRSAPVWPL